MKGNGAMKSKLLQKASAFALSGALLIACGVMNAGASSANVQYDGDSQELITLPGNDLFPTFKELVPGAQVEQRIGIDNTSENEIITLYMRAEPAIEADFDDAQLKEMSDKLVSLLHLELTLQVPGKEDQLFYSGPLSGTGDVQADGVGDLTKDIALGTYYPQAKAEIIANLTVPTSLGNEYQNALAKVRWIFYSDVVEEESDVPDNPPTVKPPVMGDPMNMILLGVLIVLSAGCMVFVVFSRRKKKPSDQ